MGWKTTVHGEVLKSKDDPSKSYIKVNEPMEKGQTYNLESAADQIESIKNNMANGKLDEKFGNELLEKAQATPDFVRFKIIKRTKTDD